MSTAAKKTKVKTSSISSGSGTEWPPGWTTMPHGIRAGRYIDPAFQQLEYDQLWSRVWQVAARVDEIPEPDDHTVYEIGERSVLLVRVDQDTVKAYHNVCPHRGTALAEGAGTFAAGNIICPFHGWRWNTEGQNQYVLSREEFRGGHLRDSDVSLKEVHSVVYAGFVFINFDPDPEPFDEFIAPIRRMLDDLVIGEMRHYWWKSIPIEANWKVAQEAFFETYHVPATHPQLEESAAEFLFGEKIEGDYAFNHHHVGYQTYAHGHGRFYPGAVEDTDSAVRFKPKEQEDAVEAMANRLQLLVDGMDAQVLQGDVDIVHSLGGKEIPEDSNLGAEYIKAVYADAANKQRPMPEPTPETLAMWGGEVFIFPNICVLTYAGNAMIYRVRPVGLDPHRCTFEILSTTTLPANAERTRAHVEHVTELMDPEQVYQIPRQDLGNIPRMQIGLRTGAIQQTWLANYHEQIILNMHQELDRYLTG